MTLYKGLMKPAVELFDADGMSARGEEMHGWMRSVWSMPRSLTGDGVRDTLQFFSSLAPGLKIHEIASGTQVFDWQIPSEWRVNEAYIRDPEGNKIVNWKENNLHLVNYSSAFQGWLDLEELDQHLYSLPELPEAIPYVTSYYEKRWGFCIAHRDRERLKPGRYEVLIDSHHFPGHLTFADLVIPGRTFDEILFTSYTCHPQMANNELSGPVLLMALARALSSREETLHYTYRFVLAPETIGALAYLHSHLVHLKSKVKAGWVVTCAGDPGPYSLVQNRAKDSLSEEILTRVIKDQNEVPLIHSWLKRGSDERQWCAPGVDLDVTTFTRSRFGTYVGYHTSLDDLSLVTAESLGQSLKVLAGCIENLENIWRPQGRTIGEPQLGRRALYPNVSHLSMSFAHQDLPRAPHRILMDVLSYCDGRNDPEAIATLTQLNRDQVDSALSVLIDADLVA